GGFGPPFRAAWSSRARWTQPTKLVRAVAERGVMASRANRLDLRYKRASLARRIRCRVNRPLQPQIFQGPAQLAKAGVSVPLPRRTQSILGGGLAAGVSLQA